MPTKRRHTHEQKTKHRQNADKVPTKRRQTNEKNKMPTKRRHTNETKIPYFFLVTQQKKKHKKTFLKMKK